MDISQSQLFARHSPVQGSVLIVGVGAVGGFLAEELAPMGITKLRLVDFDILAVENLIRHPLPQAMIGRPKASSLALQIEDRFPRCDVAGIDSDFLSLPYSMQLELVRQADVVVASVDSEACRRRLNELCTNAEVPAVYPAVWVSDTVADAEVGEIFWTLPGRHTPCYACWLSSHRDDAADDDSAGTGHGMRADIKVVVLAAASIVRALVDPKPERVGILDRERNLILVHSFTPTSRPVERHFHGPNSRDLSRSTRSGFRSRNVAVSFPDVVCEVCGGQSPPDPARERLRQEQDQRRRLEDERRQAEAARAARQDELRKLPGVSALNSAGQDIARQQRERENDLARAEAVKNARRRRRAQLWSEAQAEFERISSFLREAIQSSGAPATFVDNPQSTWHEWEINLQESRLRMGKPSEVPIEPEFYSAYPTLREDWNANQDAPFEIVGYSFIEVTCPKNSQSYMGRSHSLWFSDAQIRGRYGWYETAFKETRPDHLPYWQWVKTLRPRRDGIYLPHYGVPFEPPGRVAAFGLHPVGLEVVWPLTSLAGPGLDDFLDRWIGWFAAAAQGQLHQPSVIPERDPAGSWRTDGI